MTFIKKYAIIIIVKEKERFLMSILDRVIATNSLMNWASFSLFVGALSIPFFIALFYGHLWCGIAAIICPAFMFLNFILILIVAAVINVKEKNKQSN